MTGRERPIPFSAPMVRALLAGTKTQTRRVSGLEAINAEPDRYEFAGVTSGPGVPHFAFKDRHTGAQVLVKCKQGQPGDRMWVREAFGHFERNDTLKAGDTIYYRADGECLEIQPWRPSIHMPRWASRITLEVTGVRVERLQDISEADAIAEGVHADPRCRGEDDGAGFYRIGPVRGDSFPIARYAVLWESINGLGSWDANPWVWAVEFTRSAQ